MVGVLIQYDGGWRVAITGNLYGRIKREGQASRLFGMYQKSMFGWVMVLVVMLSLCPIMTYESGESAVSQGRGSSVRERERPDGTELPPRPQIGSVRNAGRDEQLVSTGAWRREFRKLSTAQRHPPRPSIAVLTQSSLSPIFESGSDQVATHIYHQLLVTPRPSWYAYLSLFIPPHQGLRVS